MTFIVISGRSGSGKSISLRLLEDFGFYCVDNLPISLLPALELKIHNQIEHIAVSIDARNISVDMEQYHAVLELAQKPGRNWEILYFDASDATLLKRFSETRRKHPLTTHKTTLQEAITQERKLLEPMANLADLSIDTSHLTTPQLRQILRSRVLEKPAGKMSVLLQSFGYKHSIPADADFVFDVRCLPNPYWHAELAPLTGQDEKVKSFLSQQPIVHTMAKEIKHFLDIWLPHMEADNRSYLTIAIGCTGGQHRSVFMVEHLAALYADFANPVQIRHRELPS